MTGDLDPIVDNRTLDVEVMAKLKLSTRVGVGKSLERLPQLLHDGEELLTMASGFLAGTSGLLVITSERLLFVTGAPVARLEVPTGHVRSMPGDGSSFSVTLQTPTGRAQIKQVHPRERIQEILGLVPTVEDPPLLPRGPRSVKVVRPYGRPFRLGVCRLRRCRERTSGLDCGLGAGDGRRTRPRDGKKR